MTPDERKPVVVVKRIAWNHHFVKLRLFMEFIIQVFCFFLSFFIKLLNQPGLYYILELNILELKVLNLFKGCMHSRMFSLLNFVAEIIFSFLFSGWGYGYF